MRGGRPGLASARLLGLGFEAVVEFEAEWGCPNESPAKNFKNGE